MPRTPEQMVRAHQVAVQMVRKRLDTYARTVWAGLGSYRDRDIDRLVSMIVPQVIAGQRQVANLTDAYIAALAGKAPRGIDLRQVTGAAVRGVDPAEVYRRPAATTYNALSEGKPYPAAIAAGATRLASIVATDLQLSKVRQARTSMRDGGITYYRRTLTGRKNCALCLIASTQRYYSGNLLPIHPGCDCGVLDVKADWDPGQVLDEELLEATHARVAEFAGAADRGGRAPDYRQLIVTNDHGEYGPTLSWRKDKFTGPADLN